MPCLCDQSKFKDQLPDEDWEIWLQCCKLQFNSNFQLQIYSSFLIFSTSGWLRIYITILHLYVLLLKIDEVIHGQSTPMCNWGAVLVVKFKAEEFILDPLFNKDNSFFTIIAHWKKDALDPRYQIKIISYTLCTLRAGCSQFDLTILKHVHHFCTIALCVTSNTLRNAYACISVVYRVNSFATWVLVFCLQYLMTF